MALVIRAGYFCSAGHTEAGGMQAFLEKIGPSRVAWERCFPAIQKPGPKLGRPVPRREIEGTSGPSLVSAMLSRLRMRRQNLGAAPFDLDVIVFIDDADCRFEDDAEKHRDWVAQRTAEIRSAAQQSSLPFLALFASPEIEAWFLADWDAGLGREHARLSTGDKPLRAHVEELLGGPLTLVESYGGGLRDGACANKLSDRLRSLLERLGASYSKSVDGPAMLRRVRPDKIAEVCGHFFRPAFQQMCREIQRLDVPST
ncbi:MAG: DUF4276 family protein [Polyangiaceae bacterium]